MKEVGEPEEGMMVGVVKEGASTTAVEAMVEAVEAAGAEDLAMATEATETAAAAARALATEGMVVGEGGDSDLDKVHLEAVAMVAERALVGKARVAAALGVVAETVLEETASAGVDVQVDSSKA